MMPLPSTLELLRQDEAQMFNDFTANELWRPLLAGQCSRPQLGRFAECWWPLVGGTARYADTAIVSNLEQEDGKHLFRDMLDSLEDPSKDTEKLWGAFASSVGAAAAAEPSPAGREYLATLRRFGHSSSHEGAGLLHLLSHQLSRLYEAASDALMAGYGLQPDAAAYFRVQGELWSAREPFATRLVEKYCVSPYQGYEARRAAREVGCAWQLLCEEIALEIGL